MFQHLDLTYCCVPLPLLLYTVFMKCRRLAIYINIKAFNRVKSKQLHILKTFLEYLEFYTVSY